MMIEIGTYQRRNGSKHDRKGCLTCRARRKKCLEKTHPVCGSCERLNLRCYWEPQGQLHHSARSISQLSAESAAEQSQSSSLIQLCHESFLPMAGESREKASRYFIRYYMQVLAKMLTISDMHNSFLSEFIPMAMESPVLLNALVAFSAANLASFNKSHEIYALEARSKALASLSNSIVRANPIEQETNLAACLVLSTTEVSLGHRNTWHQHLLGAKQIILSARAPSRNDGTIYGPEALKADSEGRWLLRNFAYHDVMGSVMSGKGVLLGVDYLSDMANTVDSYFGVASEVLQQVAHISSLNLIFANSFQTDQIEDSESGLGLQQSISLIEKKLHDWECPRTTDTTVYSIAYAYRHSALLYLYNRLRHLPFSDTLWIAQPHGMEQMTQIQVERTMHHIASIPRNGSPEASLLFPLFLAGISTTSPTDKNAVRSRLILILEKRGFLNFGLALQVLEKVWTLTMAKPDQLWGGLTWENILQIGGGGLNLS